jgi:hypothetical protein
VTIESAATSNRGPKKMNRTEIRVLEDSELELVQGGIFITALLVRALETALEDLAIDAELAAVGGGRIDFWP